MSNSEAGNGNTSDNASKITHKTEESKTDEKKPWCDWMMGDCFKLTAGYGLGTFAFFACLYGAWATGTNPFLQLLLCFCGGALGWVFGILITPFDSGLGGATARLGRGRSPRPCFETGASRPPQHEVGASCSPHVSMP